MSFFGQISHTNIIITIYNILFQIFYYISLDPNEKYSIFIRFLKAYRQVVSNNFEDVIMIRRRLTSYVH